jgi:hypothetical protein
MFTHIRDSRQVAPPVAGLDRRKGFGQVIKYLVSFQYHYNTREINFCVRQGVFFQILAGSKVDGVGKNIGYGVDALDCRKRVRSSLDHITLECRSLFSAPFV